MDRKSHFIGDSEKNTGSSLQCLEEAVDLGSDRAGRRFAVARVRPLHRLCGQHGDAVEDHGGRLSLQHRQPDVRGRFDGSPRGRTVRAMLPDADTHLVIADDGGCDVRDVVRSERERACLRVPALAGPRATGDESQLHGCPSCTGVRRDTPALSKVAMWRRIDVAASRIGKASAAPVPSPRRMSRSNIGRSPSAFSRT